MSHLEQPRRSRRLAGLPPELLDLPMPGSNVDVKTEVAAASFTGTVIGVVMMTGAVLFMTLWS